MLKFDDTARRQQRAGRRQWSARSQRGESSRGIRRCARREPPRDARGPTRRARPRGDRWHHAVSTAAESGVTGRACALRHGLDCRGGCARHRLSAATAAVARAAVFSGAVSGQRARARQLRRSSAASRAASAAASTTAVHRRGDLAAVECAPRAVDLHEHDILRLLGRETARRTSPCIPRDVALALHRSPRGSALARHLERREVCLHRGAAVDARPRAGRALVRDALAESPAARRALAR